MISNLHIQNIGIIDDINIELNNGFNVLTGETGAGKTLIIDSLSIIAGGRFSKEMIRKGQDHSFVELCLYLPNHEKAMEGTIIVSREIYANGRNLCKINGRLVTVNELRNFMLDIIDIHGQQDNQTILNPNSHIEYLDNFSGIELIKIKEEYQQLYEQYQKIRVELKNNYGDDKEKQRKLDLLQYQYQEIQQANLKPQEEEELTNRRSKILNAEKISANLKQIDSEIGEKAVESISNAVKALEKIENLDKKYEKKLTSLKSIYYDLQELSRDFDDLRKEIEFDEEERKQLETRLDMLFSLKRKYGNTVTEILEYQEQIKQEINEIENLDDYLAILKQNQEELRKKMLNLAKKMHIIRKEKSVLLSQKIDIQLQELEMPNARFTITIKYEEEKEFHKDGLDSMEFQICTNIGEESKPLIKIASGGEMSRIMLAIKNVLANVDKVPILVFDEIDTGISGKAANRVAEKMKQIAQKHQVLCVTHLAPIAAKGDYNYYIYKEVIQNSTKTFVKSLSEQETLEEIARIASGNITEVSLQHARELRK